VEVEELFDPPNADDIKRNGRHISRQEKDGERK